MLEVVNRFTDQPELTHDGLGSDWTELTRGHLLIIGPTYNEDGRPTDVEELAYTTPMWVGYAPREGVHMTLARLQEGNHKALAVYAVAEASLKEVSDLTRLLANAGDKIHGNWFQLWTPLIETIKILRG